MGNTYCLKDTSPRTLFRVKYPVLFAPDDTSSAMIEKGVYTFIDNTFKEKRNLLQPPTKRCVNLEVVNFEGLITTQEVVDFFTKTGGRLALPEHLFALGYQYPKLFDELQKLLTETHLWLASRPLKLSETNLSDTVDRLLQKRERALITLGREMETCVVGLRVFPGLTYNDSFGSGTNLVGYHVDMDRKWEPHYFFLVTEESLGF